MPKIPPYKFRCGIMRKKQETMMVDPDDGNKEVADGVAQGCRPQRKQSRQLRLGRRLQVQYHDRDNHREDTIRECCQPLGWSRSVSHAPHSLRFVITFRSEHA